MSLVKNVGIQANEKLTFSCGKTMKNRFMLAPLTNQQSHEDGTLSDSELEWLKMRAAGQFGLVMTCATNVQANGKGWQGELGIYADSQLAGHQKLARIIKEYGSLAVTQLFHGGMRAPEDLIGEQPVSSSINEKFNARALTLSEVHQVRADFIAAAVRTQKAGYDGVELHGAHGYLLAQFLSSEINHRTDEYGGNLENRSRLLFEVVNGIRAACGKDFLLGVRLSPERFGMKLEEVKLVAQQLINTDKIDFLDMSLWDVFKLPKEEQIDSNKSLLEHFLALDYKAVKLTVAGKITGGEEVQRVLEAGVDFVAIGKSGIIHHDFPKRVLENKDFTSLPLPVTEAHLRKEGLSPAFIGLMKKWPNFVEG